MSIKSGQRYKITNEQTKLVIDLSGGDNKSILGYSFNGGDNQQWVPERRDEHWTIRSVRHHKYLGFEHTPGDGIRLVGLDEPRLWDIEILPGSYDGRLNVKLCHWSHGTCFVADSPQETPSVGTDLQLWTAWGGQNQVWVLEEC